MKVSLFITCLADQFRPEVGLGMVRVFDRLGVAYDFPPGQTCCGQPARNAGRFDDARAVGRQFLRAFGDAETIVAPSGSCVSMVKHHLPELFAPGSAEHDAARAIAARVHELSQFLVDVLHADDVGAAFPHRVTYHDSCHLLRELGVKDQPRRLLGHVRGLELVEMAGSDTCCGFGGLFAVKQPEHLGRHGRRQDRPRHRHRRAGDRGLRHGLPHAPRRRPRAPRRAAARPCTWRRCSAVSSATRAHAAFTAGARAALARPSLGRLLEDVTVRLTERRAAAVAAVADWEALRERARAIKAATLARLDAHLEEFERQAAARGAEVHWAPTADDARRIVLDIAKAHGVRRVVKGKSMVSEEIHLNRALEAEGIAAVESDLGEFIVQLAGETPSHIIAPALHKSRGDVARLFAAKLGTPLTDDVEALTRAARQRLRAEFAAADMGTSGVNLAVAETGTIVVVENEGNIRLSTSMPPRARGADGHREGDPVGGRPGRVPDAAAAERHRPAHADLRVVPHRPAAAGRARRSRGAAHRHPRQRAVAAAGRPGGAARALLHPLRRVPERVPGVPHDRRPRVRHGCTADRSGR